MSGGVDSSVAAARLCDAGYDVIGVTLHLWDYPDDRSERGRCCAPEDQHDARRAADHLGIPHYTFDRREMFREHVVEPFVDAYLEGRTPSPCVACNRSVKMRELFPLAARLGADFVATGHYARVARDERAKARLYRGKDRIKDQSYFLHMLRSDELARLVLPLGDATKDEVRAEAMARTRARARSCASCRRVATTRSWSIAPASGFAPAPSWTRRAARSPSTAGCTGSRSASARASAWRSGGLRSSWGSTPRRRR
jgi:tRNA U34 2-thiouridine synthase MnmA/TrmU